jgi:hypothetical protein
MALLPVYYVNQLYRFIDYYTESEKRAVTGNLP